jgi:hypothetical protein
VEHYSPGGTNWAAYTHEELHGMLWEDADVTDVSAVADEWGRHSEALSDHATALRKQQAALTSDWQGEAADVAAARLGALADRIDEIAVGAAARHRAAQDAGNALALARAMMPPPAIPSWTPAPAGPTWFATFGVPPTTGFGAVATGGSSMFYGNAAAEQAKAQAVYTLRVYEASLRDGGDLVATHAARTYGTGQSTVARPPVGLPDGPRTGGVPWERLVSPLRPGTSVGVGAIAAGGVPTSIGGAAPESAVARAAQQGGLMPPVGSRGAGADEEAHVNRMPVIDQGLFIVETPTSAPVIGVVT